MFRHLLAVEQRFKSPHGDALFKCLAAGPDSSVNDFGNRCGDARHRICQPVSFGSWSVHPAMFAYFGAIPNHAFA